MAEGAAASGRDITRWHW